MAPHTEASAVGHALTLRRPLRLEQVGDRMYSVDGTPTDCVNLGINEVLGGARRPGRLGHQQGPQHRRRRDLLGHGRGRAGRGAARISGDCGIARRLDREQGFRACGVAGRDARAGVLLANPLPSRTFLNVNVPPGPVRGVRVTVQAVRNHVTKIDRRLDPRGRPYFWIEEAEEIGSRTTGPTIRPFGTGRVGDAAAAGPDASLRAGVAEALTGLRAVE